MNWTRRGGIAIAKLPDDPVEVVRFSAVRNFPAAEKALDDFFRDAMAALPILFEQSLRHRLDVHQANAGVELMKQPQAIAACVAAQVRRIPDKVGLTAKVFAGQFLGTAQHGPLRVLRRNAERSTNRSPG